MGMSLTGGNNAVYSLPTGPETKPFFWPHLPALLHFQGPQNDGATYMYIHTYHTYVHTYIHTYTIVQYQYTLVSALSDLINTH